QFNIHCFHTLTGIKFLLTVDPMLSPAAIDIVLGRVYQAYADYALKNPFYILENPIVRCAVFDGCLISLVKEVEKSSLKT
ncbi:MAG: hypothetical protein SGCHY_001753, partial [Lobulomycetales sp.]